MIINHSHSRGHTHTHAWTPGPLPLFYGLTCHDRGMTAVLSQRGGEEIGEGGEERCGFRADGEEGGVSVS